VATVITVAVLRSKRSSTITKRTKVAAGAALANALVGVVASTVYQSLWKENRRDEETVNNGTPKPDQYLNSFKSTLDTLGSLGAPSQITPSP
jgi:hypothetical protein